MAELLAKVKKEYKNVLHQHGDILENFDVSAIEPIDFTTSHKLEDDEWFRIAKFSEQEFYIEQCDDNFSTASLTQISNNEYKIISGICIIQDSQKHFQRITPSLFVNKKTFLDYSGQPKIVEQRNQIEIRQESDAIYLSESDTLYFRNISLIKAIFPGIDVMHREATQPEVDTFLNYDLIALSDYQPQKVGAQNRKRIADIGEKYKNLSEEKQQKLISYAKKKSGLDFVKKSFVIKRESDLKDLLYAMDQRYYYADIYGEERVANSVRVVKKN